MVSIKLPLVLVATIILAVIGFFTSSSVLDQDATTLQQSLFSVGVVANGLLIIILSSLTKTGSNVSETNESASTEEDDISTLYVGNLPYRANEQVVKEHFENFGYVKSVRLMKDKRTGKRKGFGFVEVGIDAAESMIQKLNDSEFQERTIKVRPAKDKVA
jgi:hypothetical protein